MKILAPAESTRPGVTCAVRDDRYAEDIDDEPAACAANPTRLLPAQIRGWARSDPGRSFLEEVGGRSISYGEFWLEVGRWCSQLQSLSLARGDRIANLLPLSIDGYLLWLAAGLLGIWEVPVNRELRGGFLRHPIAGSGCRHCFLRPEDAGLLTDNGVTGVASIVVERDGRHVSRLEPVEIDALPACGDVACVVHTSGSTGSAKGAILRWAQFATIIGRTPREWLSADDVAYAPWPTFHVTGRTPVVAMADVGGRVVLREKFSLGEFWNDVRRHGCTTATVGTAVPLLLNQPPREDDADHPLRTAYGNTSGAHNLAFQRRFGVRMMTAYGSTEAGFPIVNRHIDEASVNLAGYLRPGYRARIVDERGREAEYGQPGELLLGAALPEMMMAGYLDAPARTAEVLVGGWYHTGDLLSRRDDGGFVFVDRIRDTIRRNGENVSSTALEADLLSLDAVAECAVLGIPSALSGKEIVLLVHPAPGAAADPGALYAQLVRRYPKFMLPGYIRYVDGFPMTAGGKIRKNVLLQELALADCWRSPSADANIGDSPTTNTPGRPT